MARRTIRIPIPTFKPDDFSKLLNKIVEQDAVLGDASPLKADKDVDMNQFKNKLATADNLRSQSENLYASSISVMQQAKQAYGTAKGQTINSVGTLYNQLDIIKESLLKTYRGNEEELGKFGFNVVVGQSKSPAPKPKK